MSKFLDMDGLQYYTNKFKPGLANVIDNGEKNFINVAFTSKVATSSMPAITNNGDGTITLNGSRVGGDTIGVWDLSSDSTISTDTRYTLPEGEYVVSGGVDNKARVQVYCHDGTNAQILNASNIAAAKFNYTSELKATYPYIVWRLNIKGSSTFDNVTLYPMVCTLDDYNISQEYQPYHKNIATNNDIIQMWENA